MGRPSDPIGHDMYITGGA
uniref:Uncharacterized protein n=1 Tax=Arundo donax TaxID=35708 RepID=A0A0A8Z8H4_ARUDO